MVGPIYTSAVFPIGGDFARYIVPPVCWSWHYGERGPASCPRRLFVPRMRFTTLTDNQDLLSDRRTVADMEVTLLAMKCPPH